MAKKQTRTTTKKEQVAIGKADIKESALQAWVKLDEVIQKELTAILNGEREINASTTSAIIKFIEASTALANSPDDLSEKDRQDRMQALLASLPTFDDEDDNL